MGEATTNEVLQILAAAGHPIAAGTWRAYVARGEAPQPARRVGRTPLWDDEEIRAWVEARPGPGYHAESRRRKHMLGKEISAFGLTGKAVDTFEGNPSAAPVGYSGAALYRWSDGRWIACYYRERSDGEGVWRVLDDAEAEQWKRAWLPIPDEMPVVYDTTVGDRDTPAAWSTRPEASPRRWHVQVADRAAMGDTRLSVVRPDGEEIAALVWDGRLDEGSDELDRAVERMVASARTVWEVGPRVAAGEDPAALWEQSSEAWKFAGQEAYFAWARECRDYGRLVFAAL